MTLTVLQIIPNMGTGGAEQACADMAAALQVRGDKAIVISSGGRRVDDIEKSGALHVARDVATKNPARIIQNSFWLADFIRKNHVDIIHARSRAPAWSAFFASRMTECPFVTTFHAAYKFSSAIKRKYNRVMALSDRVIAISAFIETHITDNYAFARKNVRLVNRGIDIERFDRAKVTPDRTATLLKAWGLDDSKPIILLPARLSPIKNHSFMIEVMALLKKDGFALPTLCFVGDDQGRQAYTQQLMEHITKEGLQDCIKLVGACADMPAALLLAALVVMPSKLPEGFGRVPVEAMAMGVPVISSNTGATVDTVIDGKTGWLLSPHDPEKWAEKIKQALMMEPETREKMAAAARTHVLAHFTNEQMVAQTLAVYDELIKEKRQKNA